eukprot:TRINITY_DN12139_c0_g1_i3.p1 TRINITY_DN12139_c0_g1~~TRINITY_DN12139_c0_g1_i3.p1  ORF type:complete len:395 (+),score=69.29 TRINITY_DN12139_c0_g1_i3:414-1598(+)
MHHKNAWAERELENLRGSQANSQHQEERAHELEQENKSLAYHLKISKEKIADLEMQNQDYKEHNETLSREVEDYKKKAVMFQKSSKELKTQATTKARRISVLHEEINELQLKLQLANKQLEEERLAKSTNVSPLKERPLARSERTVQRTHHHHRRISSYTKYMNGGESPNNGRINTQNSQKSSRKQSFDNQLKDTEMNGEYHETNNSRYLMTNPCDESMTQSQQLENSHLHMNGHYLHQEIFQLVDVDHTQEPQNDHNLFNVEKSTEKTHFNKPSLELDSNLFQSVGKKNTNSTPKRDKEFSIKTKLEEHLDSHRDRGGPLPILNLALNSSLYIVGEFCIRVPLSAWDKFSSAYRQVRNRFQPKEWRSDLKGVYNNIKSKVPEKMKKSQMFLGS